MGLNFRSSRKKSTRQSCDGRRLAWHEEGTRMGYSVMFYAMNGDAFARQMRDSTDELLEKLRQKSDGHDESGNLIDLTRKICLSEIPHPLPKETGLDWF